MKIQKLMSIGAGIIVIVFVAFQLTRIGIPEITHRLSLTGKTGKTTYLKVTGPAYTYPGDCSREFRVKRELSSGLSINTAAIMEVFSPKDGLVYSDKSCTQAVTQFKLDAGQEVAKFYYKSSDKGAEPTELKVRVKPGS